MTTFTDAEIGTLIDALDSFEVRQIQGFHYPPSFVIRDCLRNPGHQVIWEGPDTMDHDAFLRQCEIERTRVALALWLTRSAPPSPLGRIPNTAA
jgi:hypothetical protein